jgi:hypothetical protein
VINNKPGTGSAFFNAARTANTMKVRDMDTVTIYGGAVSQKARDVVITATLVNGTKILGQIELSVFRVDVKPFVGGAIDQVLPMNAFANSGRDLVIRDNTGKKVRTLKPRTLATYYKDLVTEMPNGTVAAVSDGKVDDRFKRGQPDLDRAGHRHLDEVLAYGGIVFQGTIVPSGIIQADFNPNIDPKNNGKRESFNWIRNRDIRDLLFDAAGKFLKPTQCTQDFDDANDNDEDLIPDKNGNLWVFDTPAHIATPAKGRDLLPEEQTARGYWVFGERLLYAEEPVSSIQWWYWFYAHSNPKGAQNFVEAKVPGLNVVGTGPMAQPSCSTGK